MSFISPLCQLFMRSIRLSNSAVKRFELPKALSEFLINIISSKAQCAPLNSSLIESGEIVPSLFFVVVFCCCCFLLLLFSAFYTLFFFFFWGGGGGGRTLYTSNQNGTAVGVSCCIMYSVMSLAVSCSV